MGEEEKEKILLAIREMVSTAGWQHLKKDFQFQVEKLQDDINTPGGNDKVYTEKDLLIKTMLIMKDIIQYPDNYIAMAQGERPPEQEDPYEEKTEVLEEEI